MLTSLPHSAAAAAAAAAVPGRSRLFVARRAARRRISVTDAVADETLDNALAATGAPPTLSFPILNAIGAIDGTHSCGCQQEQATEIPESQRITSQNMMAAVFFDHNFLFVCTSWEGSAADIRVLRWACESGGFTVPEGKYYLVDSVYANTERFIAPYRGKRYHISQFEGNTRGRTHRSPHDLYNRRHAQLRNVVEKTFSILKKRFKILTVATPFSYKVQCQIAMACCVIYNFIRRHQGTDVIFNDVLEEQPTDLNVEETVDSVGTTESRRGDALRTIITDQL